MAQRSDKEHADRVQAAATLLALGWSQRQVGRAVGRSKSWVVLYALPHVPSAATTARVTPAQPEPVPRNRDGTFAAERRPTSDRQPGKLLGRGVFYA